MAKKAKEKRQEKSNRQEKRNRDSDKSKRFVRACSFCGSNKIRAASGMEFAAYDAYGLSSMSGIMLCENCGRQILPIEVDADRYEKWAKGMKNKGTATEAPGIGLGVNKTAEAKNAEETDADSGINIHRGLAGVFIPGGILLILCYLLIDFATRDFSIIGFLLKVVVIVFFIYIFWDNWNKSKR